MTTPPARAATGSLAQARALVGPALVIAGASMWGLETYWRIPLGKKLDADILVFHEHWMGLTLTLPFLVVGAGALRTVSRKAIVSMVGSGVLGSALGTVCFTQALALLNSSLANLLLNVQPVVSVLVSWVWLRERPRARVLPLGRGGARVWRGDGVEPGSAREPAPARARPGLHRRDRAAAGARRRRSGGRP